MSENDAKEIDVLYEVHDELNSGSGAERANARTRRGARECAETPEPCITGVSSSDGYVFQCLGHGVDSLYISHKGILKPVYKQILPELKFLAQSQELVESNQAQIQLGHHVFEIQPRGKGLYPYIIRDNSFYINICDGLGQLPYTHTQISSEYLLHAGVEAALLDLNECIDDMAEVVSYSTTSRLDIYMDIVSNYPFHALNEDSFATKSKTFVRYADGGFEGLKIGKGNFVFRLYDKTKEIKVSKKFYMYDVWKKAGWDGVSPVFRLEYQMRGQLVKALGMLWPKDIMEQLPEAWAKLCKYRLRLLVPGNHHERNRHPTEPMWLEIGKALGVSYPMPFKKEYSSKRLPPDYYLFGHGLSPVLSYMAIEGIDDLEEGFRAFREGLMKYHRMRHSDPEALLTHMRRKVAERRRKYNIKLNPPDDDDGE